MLDGTYAGLQASVAGWLRRTDLTSAIPDFIAMAEAQMSRRLLALGPVRGMMCRTDATLNAEFVSLPSDFMGANSIYVDGNGSGTCLQKLKIATPDEINVLKAEYFNQDGSPRRFAIIGSSMQLWPWNGVDVAAELTYWQRVPALATAGSNWLFTLHPDAYLYGSLVQAAPYMKADTRVPLLAEAFETILADIVAADKVERTAAEIAMPMRPTP